MPNIKYYLNIALAHRTEIRFEESPFIRRKP